MRNAQASSKSKIWSPLFISIVVLSLFIAAVPQSLITGTPLYIQEIGGNNLFSGILIATYIAAAGVARLVSGRIVDQHSRRIALLAGAALIIAGSLLPLIFSSIYAQLPARILQGFGFAIAQTGASSSVADVLPIERLGEGLGYFGLGQALAMALGPTLAIWLVSLEYSEALSIGIGILGIAIFIIGLTIRYEKHPTQLAVDSGYMKILETRKLHTESETLPKQKSENEKSSSRVHSLSFLERIFDKETFKRAVPVLFFGIAIPVYTAYTTLFAQQAGYGNPSIFFLVCALTAIVIRLMMSRAMDTIAAGKLYLVPIVAGCITNLGICFIHNEIIYYCLGIGYGLCIGIALPLMNTVIVKAASPTRWGAANSLYFLMYDIGLGVGMILWGFLLDALGFVPLYVGGVVIFVLSYLAAYRFFPRVSELQIDEQ